MKYVENDVSLYYLKYVTQHPFSFCSLSNELTTDETEQIYGILMDLNELFRSMFGFSRNKPPDFPFDREPPEGSIDADNHTDIPIFFGFRGSGGMDQIFAHFHGDMQRQMEEMDRQMQDMFKNFGSVEFSAKSSTGPEQYPVPGSRNPRDEMLKQPDTDQKSPGTVVPAPSPAPELHRPWSFFGSWRHPKSEPMKDTNLDDEIKSPEDLNKLFENTPRRPQEPNTELVIPGQRETTPRNFSFHRSMSVITRSNDGKVEHRKTVRDSSGKEETTLTRSIGDQSYSVTTKTDQSGATEKIENYQNMDENDLQNFEKKWQGPQIKSSSPGQEMIKSDSILPEGTSLLHRIFGFDPFKKGS
ncbi:hypothetical protein FSP39_002415 [Pinctada imbricata]|uniref:HCLS1-associated protein X-1 n=1 Tax=Pinctada imbricata TaxID=66713 RepID=A0AA89BW77_PINIB|nr:hypothetical protein FSP39_002415 [Pinctada imbricata]